MMPLCFQRIRHYCLNDTPVQAEANDACRKHQPEGPLLTWWHQSGFGTFPPSHDGLCLRGQAPTKVILFSKTDEGLDAEHRRFPRPRQTLACRVRTLYRQTQNQRQELFSKKILFILARVLKTIDEIRTHENVALHYTPWVIKRFL